MNKMREALLKAKWSVERAESIDGAFSHSGTLKFIEEALAEPEPAGEPVGEVDSTGMAVLWSNKPLKGAKLYTHPTPEAVRKLVESFEAVLAHCKEVEKLLCYRPDEANRVAEMFDFAEAALAEVRAEQAKGE